MGRTTDVLNLEGVDGLSACLEAVGLLQKEFASRPAEDGATEGGAAEGGAAEGGAAEGSPPPPNMIFSHGKEAKKKGRAGKKTL